MATASKLQAELNELRAEVNSLKFDYELLAERVSVLEKPALWGRTLTWHPRRKKEKED